MTGAGAFCAPGSKARPLCLLAALLAAACCRVPAGEAEAVPGPAEAAAPAAPQVPEVKPEDAEKLRGQFIRVAVRLDDGRVRECVLEGYEAQTGVLVVSEKVQAAPEQLRDAELAAIQFKEALRPQDPWQVLRRTSEFLRERGEETRERVQREARQAKDAGRLDEYLAGHEAGLKAAKGRLPALAEMARVVAALREKDLPPEELNSRLRSLVREIQDPEAQAVARTLFEGRFRARDRNWPPRRGQGLRPRDGRPEPGAGRRPPAPAAGTD